MYKLHTGGAVVRLSDGALIPPDEGNADYAEYLKWLDPVVELVYNEQTEAYDEVVVAPGGEPLPADPPDYNAIVNEIRDRRMSAGFAFMGYRWDSDRQSRENIIGTVSATTAGIALPLGFTWRTEDDQNVPMDSAAMVGLGATLMQYVNACYVRSWELKAALAAAQDPSTVDLEAGWPVE